MLIRHIGEGFVLDGRVFPQSLLKSNDWSYGLVYIYDPSLDSNLHAIFLSCYKSCEFAFVVVYDLG